MRREYEQPCFSAKLQVEINQLSVPPLMEIATILEALATIPPLRKFPQIVAAATNLGARVDDCYDQGLERRKKGKIAREAFINHAEERIPDRVNPLLLIRFWQAWNDLVKTVNTSILEPQEKDKLLRNSATFVDNLVTVENHALSIPEKDWTQSLAGRYRRAVCLEWAVYFTSLASESKLNLIPFPAEEGILGPKKYYFHLLNEQSKRGKWIRKLYYGASTYQLVCDWTGKEINKQRLIPGYGSIGDVPPEERYSKLFNRYLMVARRHGMTPAEEIIARHFLPLLRNFSNGRIQRTLTT